MTKIQELVNNAKQVGYNEANAEAKVCQDIILSLISRCNFTKNIYQWLFWHAITKCS